MRETCAEGDLVNVGAEEGDFSFHSITFTCYVMLIVLVYVGPRARGRRNEQVDRAASLSTSSTRFHQNTGGPAPSKAPSPTCTHPDSAAISLVPDVYLTLGLSHILGSWASSPALHSRKSSPATFTIQ